MTTKEEKVRAIIELKQEYDIGSQDAFRYLQAQETYTRISRVMRDSVKQPTIEMPSLKTIAHLCWGARATVCCKLEVECISRVIESYSKRAPAEHYVRLFVSDKPDEILSPDMVWDFDFERFFTDFAEFYNESQKIQTAFDGAFETFISSPHKYFRSGDIATSLEDFKKRDDLLLSKRPNTDGLDTLTRKLTAIKRLEECNRTFWAEDSYKGPDFSKVTYEERKYLLDEWKLYKRALKEGVSNRLDVQRRIALDFLTGQCRCSIGEGLIILEVFDGDREGDERTEQEKERNKQACAYMRRVIVSNRRWLEKVLS